MLFQTSSETCQALLRQDARSPSDLQSAGEMTAGKEGYREATEQYELAGKVAFFKQTLAIPLPSFQ